MILFMMMNKNGGYSHGRLQRRNLYKAAPSREALPDAPTP